MVLPVITTYRWNCNVCGTLNTSIVSSAGNAVALTCSLDGADNGRVSLAKVNAESWELVKSPYQGPNRSS